MDCRLPSSETLGTIIPVAIVGFLLFVVVLVMLVLIYMKVVALLNRRDTGYYQSEPMENYDRDVKYINEIEDKKKTDVSELDNYTSKLETLEDDTDSVSQVESEDSN